MSSKTQTRFGLCALFVCTVISLATPWPTADALLSTHSSPLLNHGNVQVQNSNSQWVRSWHSVFLVLCHCWFKGKCTRNSTWLHQGCQWVQQTFFNFHHEDLLFRSDLWKRFSIRDFTQVRNQFWSNQKLSPSSTIMRISYQKEVDFEKLEPEMQLLIAAMIDHLNHLPISVQRSFRHELSATLAESFNKDFWSIPNTGLGECQIFTSLSLSSQKWPRSSLKTATTPLKSSGHHTHL